VHNAILDELVDFFKRGVIWIIVTLIFNTRELKDEALRHFYSGVVRVPGVCYGANVVKGYQAIARVFPERCGVVRLDYILGYCKVMLLIAFTCGIFMLIARYLV
jgi:hypothetical protein